MESFACVAWIETNIKRCTHNLFEVSYATLTWNMYEPNGTKEWNTSVYVEMNVMDIICVSYAEWKRISVLILLIFMEYNRIIHISLCLNVKRTRCCWWWWAEKRREKIRRKNRINQLKKTHVNRKISISWSWKYVKTQSQAISRWGFSISGYTTEQQLNFIFSSLHIHITASISQQCVRCCTHISTTYKALGKR